MKQGKRMSKRRKLARVQKNETQATREAGSLKSEKLAMARVNGAPSKEHVLNPSKT